MNPGSWITKSDKPRADRLRLFGESVYLATCRAGQARLRLETPICQTFDAFYHTARQTGPNGGYGGCDSNSVFRTQSVDDRRVSAPTPSSDVNMYAARSVRFDRSPPQHGRSSTRTASGNVAHWWLSQIQCTFESSLQRSVLGTTSPTNHLFSCVKTPYMLRIPAMSGVYFAKYRTSRSSIAWGC
ncbi:hypothetical protein HGRIS_005897 [Hohenbuehelia grisea]|uniref:Uncharacterized protein n=1 Tax=Hohenbuehelia grisea TaxID=104357 RepID=A0ABR3JY66_9AGAR